MKKQLLMLLPSLALMLASCDNPINSQDDSSEITSSTIESSSTTEEDLTPTDWTDEEKAIMLEHLGGNLIPFYYVQDYEVIYYEEYDCVSVESISGTEADVVYYCAVVEEAGYERFEVEGTTVLEKAVSDEWTIQIQIYLSDLGFALDAYYYQPDPLYEVWPSEIVETFLLEGADEVPAFPNAAYYMVEEDADALYIGCGEQDISSEDTYTAILEAASWSIDTSDYAYSGIIGLSPNENVQVTYYFNASYSLFIICIENCDNSPVVWPSELLSEWLGEDANQIPVFEAEEYEIYDFTDSFDFLLIAALDQVSIETTEEVYTSLLSTARWFVSDEDYENSGLVALAPSGTIMINYYFKDGVFYIMIMPYEPTMVTNEWPTDLLSSIMEGCPNLIPVYEADEYVVETEEEEDIASAVYIQIEGQNEEKVAAYLKLLTANGWDVPEVPSEDYGYECYAGDSYEVDVILNEDGTLYLYFYHWAF